MVGSIIAAIISTHAAACMSAGTTIPPAGIARQSPATNAPLAQPSCST